MKTTKFNLREGINAKSHRKENNYTDTYQVIAFDQKNKDRIRPFVVAVDLRFYHTNATSYACVWIHDNEQRLYGSGSGKAGGYGYHRGSQAAQCAFISAGVDFDEAIGGRGNTAIEEALHAIAEKMGYKTFFINHTHA